MKQVSITISGVTFDRAFHKYSIAPKAEPMQIQMLGYSPDHADGKELIETGVTKGWKTSGRAKQAIQNFYFYAVLDGELHYTRVIASEYNSLISARIAPKSDRELSELELKGSRDNIADSLKSEFAEFIRQQYARAASDNLPTIGEQLESELQAELQETADEDTGEGSPAEPADEPTPTPEATPEPRRSRRGRVVA